jgi:hypothetical protein
MFNVARAWLAGALRHGNCLLDQVAKRSFIMFASVFGTQQEDGQENREGGSGAGSGSGVGGVGNFVGRWMLLSIAVASQHCHRLQLTD